MKHDDCIFCKLANGDIPTNMIYQDDEFAVILDSDPATKGHALIIPKDHYANIYEIPEGTAANAMRVAKYLATGMTEKLSCDGFNLVQNNGEVAGQTVMHFHLHLIPRYKGDGQANRLCWNHTKFTDAEMKEICELLKTK